MKIRLLSLLAILVLSYGCQKDSVNPTSKNALSENAIVVSQATNNSLIAIDTTKLIFSSSGTDVNKIKVGSILVSDITSAAPNGYLRKVTAISNQDGNVVMTTEQALITDVIQNGAVTFKKTFTDADIIGIDSSGIDVSSGRVQSLSFNFKYDKVLHDDDENYSTTYDQVKIYGEIVIEPSFNFELKISDGHVDKFLAQIDLKNTNTLSAESKITLAKIKEEIVLKTFQLKPYTIYVPTPFGVLVPVPVAKQWIAIVIGIDGSLTAKVIAGVENKNTAVAGIAYENNQWSTINTQQNTFTLKPLSFEGAVKVEPWLQVRYEIRPFGVKDSRIYIGVKGSVIGEASIIPTGLSATLKWAVAFSAKAQMKLFQKSILDYEKVFFEKEFPISEFTTFAVPTLTTKDITSLTSSSVQSGGTISSDGGATISAKGVCFSLNPNPTLADSKTTNGTGIESFNSSISGLNQNTKYYLRAYATNSTGTAYGNEISFTTATQINLPQVTTSTVSNITSNSAQSGGAVLQDGGASITAKGVCWSSSHLPTINDNITNDGTSITSFVSQLTNLSANTTYFVRAYATNSLGTSYGNQIEFTTGTIQVDPTVTDIDGNNYTTVVIGSQVWLGQNLRVTRFLNGDFITPGTHIASYNNSQTNEAIYGKLYSWYAVTDSRKLCPNGWHTPSLSEWGLLSSFLGGSNLAGGKLKEIGNAHWNSPNTGADNTSGFNGLPGGAYQYGTPAFYGLGRYGFWWSTDSGMYRTLHYDDTVLHQNGSRQEDLMSVRCIKD